MQEIDLDPRYLRLRLELLAENVPGTEVWAYGSRVTHNAHETSDLDLVIRNPRQLEQPLHLQKLRAALADSNLPIVVDVLDWASIPDDFRREIQSQVVVPLISAY